MSHGLRPHYHQYYLYNIERYYDRNRGCMVKKVTFRCMICGKEYYECYEYKPPPRSKNKALEKNKKKYSNRS